MDADDPIVSGVGRAEMPGVLADGEQQILGPGRGKLIGQLSDVEGVDLFVPHLGRQFGAARRAGRSAEIVGHHAPAGLLEPAGPFRCQGRRRRAKATITEIIATNQRNRVGSRIMRLVSSLCSA